MVRGVYMSPVSLNVYLNTSSIICSASCLCVYCVWERLCARVRVRSQLNKYLARH